MIFLRKFRENLEIKILNAQNVQDKTYVTFDEADLREDRVIPRKGIVGYVVVLK